MMLRSTRQTRHNRKDAGKITAENAKILSQVDRKSKTQGPRFQDPALEQQSVLYKPAACRPISPTQSTSMNGWRPQDERA